MKAMILAAGRGSRLKPLTNHTAKPLLKAGGKTLIEHNLSLLKKAGIQEVVVNVSHCATQMMDFLGDGRRYGMRLWYSEEQPLPLGTGGGIRRALPLLGKDFFVVISADIWSEFSFPSAFFEADTIAHLVLVSNPSYHVAGDYELQTTGRINLQGNKKLTYANIAKLHPTLFSHCQTDIFSLASVLEGPIQEGRVSGQYYEGRWFNVGTVEELQKLRKTFGEPVTDLLDLG